MPEFTSGRSTSGPAGWALYAFDALPDYLRGVSSAIHPGELVSQS
jgi:hypothetical protein